MDLRVALRTAIVAKLEAALNLPYAPYAVATISYRPTRAPIDLPAVTFFDFGGRPDDMVPLDDRNVHIDVWTAGDLDLAEEIAHVVNAALDHQRLELPGDEGGVAFLGLQSDRDETQRDADLMRKMLTYRLLSYEFNGPAFWGA